MHTVQYHESFDTTLPGLPVTAMELKVYDNISTAIHCLSTSAGTTFKTQYCFTDPVTKAVTAYDYDTASPAAGVLQVFNYQYKVDHIRVVITGTGTSGGTIRITGNVAS